MITCANPTRRHHGRYLPFLLQPITTSSIASEIVRLSLLLCHCFWDLSPWPGVILHLFHCRKNIQRRVGVQLLTFGSRGLIVSTILTMAKAGELTKGTEAGKITLWAFHSSSCTWRVRLALDLKGIPFEYKAVNFEEKSDVDFDEFRKASPLQYVPAVEVDGVTIADSMAIIMYFEEKFPDKRPLLPVDLVARAIVRQVVYIITANIQPLQNRRILKQIEAISVSADARLKWAQDHINYGFTALEQLLEKVAGKFTVGDELTLADVVLVPQIANAKRYQVDMAPYLIINRIGKALFELPEVEASVPANQPDYPK